MRVRDVKGTSAATDTNMTGTGAFTYYALLPPDLLARAYMAGRERAWTRADAVRVVTILRERGHRVLDVETWLPTRPGPTPLIDDWDEDRPMSAIAFIETFRWKPTDGADRDLDVVFNISA